MCDVVHQHQAIITKQTVQASGHQESYRCNVYIVFENDIVYRIVRSDIQGSYMCSMSSAQSAVLQTFMGRSSSLRYTYFKYNIIHISHSLSILWISPQSIQQYN